MAMKKDYIKSRRLAKTYGVACSSSLESCTGKLSKGFIERNKFYNDYKKSWWVSDCMQNYVKINEEVQFGEVCI